mmetsp:Transcript_19604/g.57866  ORF Transcript_19604/g.57866 Transcript_19604/m.57866 type:complete len:241 (-) Transcript_19604:80-802(-)
MPLGPSPGQPPSSPRSSRFIPQDCACRLRPRMPRQRRHSGASTTVLRVTHRAGWCESAPASGRRLLLVAQAVYDPVQTLVQAASGEGTAALYLPVVALIAMERQGRANLRGGHRAVDVLLVCEHEEDGVGKVLVGGDRRELLLHHVDVVPIRAIHHEDDRVGVDVVGAPGLSQCLLPTQVPHLESYVSVHHLLHIAPNCRLRLDHVAEVELVKDCRLPRVVEADHHDLVLLVAHEARPER